MGMNRFLQSQNAMDKSREGVCMRRREYQYRPGLRMQIVVMRQQFACRRTSCKPGRHCYTQLLKHQTQNMSQTRPPNLANAHPPHNSRHTRRSIAHHISDTLLILDLVRTFQVTGEIAFVFSFRRPHLERSTPRRENIINKIRTMNVDREKWQRPAV
jgi:hypothetical protein